MKVDEIYLVIGGILRMFDIIADLLYLSTQQFNSIDIFYLSAAFLILPSIILIIIFSISIGIQKQSCSDISVRKEILRYVIILVSELAGLSWIFYGIMKKVGEKDVNYKFISKMVAIVFIFFDSMPELILQTYNAGETRIINGFFYASCIFSACYIIFSIFRIIKTLDNSSKIQSTIEMISKTANVSIDEIKSKQITLEDS